MRLDQVERHKRGEQGVPASRDARDRFIGACSVCCRKRRQFAPSPACEPPKLRHRQAAPQARSWRRSLIANSRRSSAAASIGARGAMKYVLVTGGVVSGLGKGVTASSIGVLLKACGHRVTSIKIGAPRRPAGWAARVGRWASAPDADCNPPTGSADGGLLKGLSAFPEQCHAATASFAPPLVCCACSALLA